MKRALHQQWTSVRLYSAHTRIRSEQNMEMVLKCISAYGSGVFFSTYAAVLTGPVHHGLVVRGISRQREGGAGKFQLVLSRRGRSPLFPVPPQLGAPDSPENGSRRASAHSALEINRDRTCAHVWFGVRNFAVSVRTPPLATGWHFASLCFIRAWVGIPFAHGVGCAIDAGCQPPGFSTRGIRQLR